MSVMHEVPVINAAPVSLPAHGEILVSGGVKCFDAQFLFACEQELISNVSVFAQHYPQFRTWLTEKVFPGLRTGERSLYLLRRENMTAGLLVLKQATSEVKLCSLRVHPEFQNQGYGVRLFEKAFDILGTNKPLLSISELQLTSFERVFNYFGFKNEATYPGLYLPSATELSYNGRLIEKSQNAVSQA